MPRPSTTTKGTSLIETVVACGIFAVLTTLIVMILTQSRRADQKLDMTTDANQMALVLIEKLKAEIRGCRVLGTSPDGTTLSYWVARRQGSTLILTPTGQSDWEPGFPAAPAVAQVFPSDHSLWRDFQGQHQRLGGLGQDGEVQFTYTPANHTLRLQLLVGDRNEHDAARQNLIRLDYTAYLTNQ